MYIGIFIVLTCSGILILLAMYMIVSILFLTPFYPSRVSKLKLVIENLKLTDLINKRFVDVGSGDGRVVVWAARSGMNATGIEINPFLTLWTRIYALIARVSSKVKVLNEDWNKHNYSDYDIVYLYIYREHMDKLLSKFQKELKPGTILISNTFKFSKIEPYQSLGKFHIYKI